MIAVAEPEPLDIVDHLLGAVLVAGDGAELEQRSVDAVGVVDRHLSEAHRVEALEAVEE